MRQYAIISNILLVLVISSCASVKQKKAAAQANTLDQLANMMAGTFSSAEQAIQDTTFFDINLVMHPIWEADESAKWLYVEQAVTAYLERPYRQRVYRLSTTDDGVFESKVYELPAPKRFIHAWDNPTLFNTITPDSLIVREGCAVYLRPEGNCYAGSTNEKDCKSTLRGASYATSIVKVCQDQIVSWDQGWSATDEQVWGAEVSGYIFKRK